MYSYILIIPFLTLSFAYDKKWEPYMGELRWYSYEEALEAAQRRKLPILAFFGGLECEQCGTYYQVFDQHPRFKALAKRFILCGLDETDVYYHMEPFNKEEYSPKFAFFDSNGKLLPFDSYDDDEHKYFYSNIDLVINAMEDVDDYMADYQQEL
ncbi:hypothetical protein ENU1_192970 [Entamoeba nuttalli P19]|uniref:Thioredoxin n=2 Tax=Entamoeba nuttalli TaxID=412467 RepID=K2GUR5_ENTNP|nr:hypothetical protein ENU1_192970 [Entamoeba nuttalli P19]EKE37582.1 hypothetical protein ENU1_192970 [Entamoeba nuttalli P19]|eukprot:XP_008860108.1 hypothetical protein ENU1_192970 [Entamoeba nuttalli P19]